MKKIIMGVAIFIFLGLFSLESFADDDFFGISFNEWGSFDSFAITDYTAEDGVSYTHTEGDPLISAFGNMSYSNNQTSFVFKVTNKTSTPIETNFFTDSFTLVTKNYAQYKLKNESAKGVQYINPNDTVRYDAYLDNQAINKDNIKWIILEIGIANKVTIALKPLPQQREVLNHQPINESFKEDLILDLNKGTLGRLQIGQLADINTVKDAMEQKPDDTDAGALFSGGCLFYHRGIEICNADGFDEKMRILGSIEVHCKEITYSDFRYNKFAGKIIPSIEELKTEQLLKEKFGTPIKETKWMLRYSRTYGMLTFLFDEDGSLRAIDLDVNDKRFIF